MKYKIIMVVLLLFGCNSGPDNFNPVLSDGPRSRGDHLVPYIDDGTGCQYIGYISHGLTPRMSEYRDGKQVQLGCRNTIKIVNPITGD